MDDYIQNNGFDKFRDEVLAKAETIEQWEKQFKKEKEDKREEKVTQGLLANKLAEEYRAQLAWNIPAKAWYQYQKRKAGIWSETPLETVKMLVIDELNLMKEEYTDPFVNGVVSLLKSHLRVEYWEVMPSKVCLADVVIDIRNLETTEHQPGYKFLSSLPFKWADREVGCEPIKQWLLSTCGDRADWLEVIRATMNATITERGAELQRYIELIGAGGTGKGTILRLIQALLGKENYAVTTLKQLETNRFETALFYGKKAIFITDSERYAGEVSVLKAITGGDDLRLEKKSVQQTDSFVFTGVVWVACNEAIQSSDYTNALARRRLSMSYEKVIPPHLRRDVIEEFKPYLPGLLAWVLSLTPDVVADYVRNTTKCVPSLASFGLEVLLETNPLANWADHCLYYDPNIETKIGNANGDSKDCLYANYLEWASSNGHSGMTTQRFSSNLLNLLKTQLSIDATKRKTQHGRHITKIGIRQPGHNFPFLISGNDDPNDDPMTTSKTTESIGNDGFEQNDDLLRDSLNNESTVNSQTNDSFPKEREESSHGRHNPSKPSLPRDTGRHSPIIESSLKAGQVVITPPRNKGDDDSKKAESTGNDGFEPLKEVNEGINEGVSIKARLREGQTVYPTTGKYQGKECKVSAIADNEIWAYPVTTQLGVVGTTYQASELSLTPPVVATTSSECEPYQTSIDWDGWENEEYLDCPED
ncbi:hypothetical protein IQ247_09730 [Plectonema cf. radiosum LEGE 06105]|uniref:SF3 helicase domain-containing protein n=1 Tax=Plectonema cf. radiosum LEGE 06105 TaxID=945769 RepID=A0A8J7EZC7_9CYAN|nr:DUF5906 domain-containing protein [Plectonema radiosum]MBE9212961.1 hypothetical protein [Plectonema cf. radiosum LEGE 06105]